MHRFYWSFFGLLIAVDGCASNIEGDRGEVEASERVVRSVISKNLKVDPSAIEMDKPISEPPLNADELDLVEIVMDLEEQLIIVVPEEALEHQLGKGPVQITPRQLATIVREASKSRQSMGQK
jgi:acyl carrier protein